MPFVDVLPHAGRVLPDFAVEVYVGPIDGGQLRVLWDDEVYEGVGDNRVYGDLTGADWAEVGLVVAEKEELLAAAAQAAGSVDEFDVAADAMVSERYPEGNEEDEGPLARYSLLDLGVMSAVAALSAAGCVPTTSCRGHRVRGEPSPLVRFAADEERLPLVRRAATESGAGLVLDEAGLLQLYASAVDAFPRFARRMLALRAEFESLPEPLLDERPDAADDYQYVRRRDLANVLGRAASQDEPRSRQEGQDGLW